MRFLLTLFLLLSLSGLALSADSPAVNGPASPAPSQSQQPSPDKTAEPIVPQTGPPQLAAPAPVAQTAIPPAPTPTLTAPDSKPAINGGSTGCIIWGLPCGSLADWAMVLVTVIAATIALRTLKALQLQVKANEDAANAAEGAMKIAKVSADAAFEEAWAIKLSERAYVKIEHKKALQILPTSSHGYYYSLEMEMKNVGKTPATVTALVMKHEILAKDQQLTVVPSDPDSGGMGEMILYPGEALDFDKTFPDVRSEVAGIKHGTKVSYVYGYVDYIDLFGQRHRAGYARSFDASGSSTILIGPGLNYDRERQRGEGIDWGQSA